MVVSAADWWLLPPDALAPVGTTVGSAASERRAHLTSYVVCNTRLIEQISVRPIPQPPGGATVTTIACRWHDPLGTFATAAGPLDGHCAETREVTELRLEPHVTTRDWDVPRSRAAAAR